MALYVDIANGNVTCDNILEKTSTNGVSIDSLKIKDSRWIYNSTGWFASQSKSADYTLAAIDCGCIFVDSSGGAVVITLPATVLGYSYTIICSADSANAINISPNSADNICGMNFTRTDDKDYILAAPKKGDYIKIHGDGSAGWFVIEASGVWTRQS